MGDRAEGGALRGNRGTRRLPAPPPPSLPPPSLRGLHLWRTSASTTPPPRPVHNNPCLVVGCNDTEALKEAFEKHGTVQDVFNPEGQNFAFVRFEDNYAAEAARKALDGSTIAGAQVAVYDGKCSNKAVLDWRKGLAIA